MLTSYHVHSTYSDGVNSIPELVRGAIDVGLDELGISDHYVFLGNGRRVEWSMDFAQLPAYVAELQAVAHEVAGSVTVRMGVEADYDPATADELAEVLVSYPFDYVIGSVHFLDGFAVDERRDEWDHLTEPERNEMIRKYWRRIAQMADSRLFDFAGHLDLYKKFGHLPTEDISDDIDAALDALARAGMAVELNTAGWYKPDIEEAYPSPAIIRGCRARRIPMLINADAHGVQDLATGFDRAIQLLRASGYTHKAVFSSRQMSLVPLSNP